MNKSFGCQISRVVIIYWDYVRDPIMIIILHFGMHYHQNYLLH